MNNTTCQASGVKLAKILSDKLLDFDSSLWMAVNTIENQNNRNTLKLFQDILENICNEDDLRYWLDNEVNIYNNSLFNAGMVLYRNGYTGKDYLADKTDDILEILKAQQYEVFSELADWLLEQKEIKAIFNK